MGILATETTIKNRLYSRWLEKFSIEQALPSNIERGKITEIIMNVLSGKKLKKDKEILKEIIENMVKRGAEAVVLGCTDLPLLIKQEDCSVRIFDSLEILAESTVKYATGIVNKEVFSKY